MDKWLIKKRTLPLDISNIETEKDTDISNIETENDTHVHWNTSPKIKVAKITNMCESKRAFITSVVINVVLFICLVSISVHFRNLFSYTTNINKVIS